jgi:bacillopeptidase F (M6 metalloprotease family)
MINDIQTRTTIISDNYLENFEEGNGNYHAHPMVESWKWGVPNAGPYMPHSGINCWATGLNTNYPINANWKLISSQMTANIDNPVLKFWHWYDMNEYYDGGNVKISVDSGVSWILLHPQNGYPGSVFNTNHGIPNESCYTGMSEWNEATFTLPVLSGQHFLMI